MNLKLCKKLRRLSNFRDVQYQDTAFRQNRLRGGNTWLFRGQAILDPTCGRALYQQAKKTTKHIRGMK